MVLILKRDCSYPGLNQQQVSVFADSKVVLELLRPQHHLHLHSFIPMVVSI